MKPLIYLASPHAHPSLEVRQGRVVAAAWFTSRLIEAGHAVYSPIVHNGFTQRIRPVAFEEGHDWYTFDYTMLSLCHQLFIAQIDGWRESVGVARELRIAQTRRIPVVYVACTDVDLKHPHPANPASLEFSTNPFPRHIDFLLDRVNA